jgi:mono/diheme cytochrome c family protein
MYILITFIVVTILAAFITIDNDLRLLKQKQFHSAIEHSRFMRLMDIIFNKFLTWRLWKKILPVSGLVVLMLAGGIYFYIRYALPKIPPVEDIVINHHDTALLNRGEYLVEHVAICVDCHSPRDVNYFSWPIVKGQKGAGGPFLSQKLGYAFPGESFVPNITPANLGSWSDGELYRLLTTGIDKNGKTVNHVMPFQNFAQADPTDLKAIIAYIRTLKPISNKPAGSTTINFFHSLYNRTIPRKTDPIYLDKLKTSIDSGYYLVTIASCNDCHTPKKWLEINDYSKRLSGGIEYPLPTGGFVHSANLTPDESGLGTWSETAFINKFRSYRDSGAIYKVAPNELNSLMPWSTYAYMTDNDLHAIYTYLKSIKPVYNPVVKFTSQSIKKLKARDQTE